jgi:crotonobetainyl-CoA:carnitine CoA-transferase CaiB-like acyl-CoA transferase
MTGIRILELGGGVATRYCGHVFARLGAQVEQVGVDTSGDDLLGFAGDAGRAFGRWLDEGKQAGDATAVRRADVVITGQDARSVAEAAARCEGLAPPPILLGLTWFGTDGPYAGWTGSDEVVHALDGVAYSFGPAEGPPTLPQGHAPQIMAGANAANIALAALLEHPELRPRRLDVTVLESALCLSEVGAVGAIDDPKLVSTRLGINRVSPT